MQRYITNSQRQRGLIPIQLIDNAVYKLAAFPSWSNQNESGSSHLLKLNLSQFQTVLRSQDGNSVFSEWIKKQRKPSETPNVPWPSAKLERRCSISSWSHICTGQVGSPGWAWMSIRHPKHLLTQVHHPDGVLKNMWRRAAAGSPRQKNIRASLKLLYESLVLPLCAVATSAKSLNGLKTNEDTVDLSSILRPSLKYYFNTSFVLLQIYSCLQRRNKFKAEFQHQISSHLNRYVYA